MAHFDPGGRPAPVPARPHSPRAQRPRSAGSLPSLKHALHETKDGLKVELQGKPADLAVAFDRFSALTE